MSNIQDAERSMQVMKQDGKEPHAIVCRSEWYADTLSEVNTLCVETPGEAADDVTIYTMLVCVVSENELPDSMFNVVTAEELSAYVDDDDMGVAERDLAMRAELAAILGTRRWLRSGFCVSTAVATAVREADGAKAWRKRMRWELSQAAGIDEDDYTAMLAEVSRMRAALDGIQIDHHGELAEALGIDEPESWTWKGMLDDIKLGNI